MPDLLKTKDRIEHFLKTEIWRLSHGERTKTKAWLIKAMQILLLAIQNFIRDKCALRASALTFYTLLSVVPVAAMAFGIAKGFGLEHRLENQLYQQLAGHEAVVEKIITFARSLLQNTQGGLIAGIGVALLFWSAIKVLNHIETTLNEIWKVRSRSFIRMFTDYLTIMIVSPLVVVISSSVNVFIKTQVTTIAGKVALLEMASPLIFFALKLLPYGLIWLLFILIYLVMPNTRVRFTSALVAGFVAGTVFQFSQTTYIHAQVLLARNNAIYGSFAALPFFLIWLQLSWMIVLFGAQVAYAHQHVGQYVMNLNDQEISVYTQKQYALWILYRIIQAFQSAQAPPTAEQLATHLRLSHGTVQRLLEHLRQCGLIAALQPANGEDEAFQPARDIHGLDIGQMLEAWDKAGNNERPAVPAPAEKFNQICKVLEEINDELRRSPANRLIKDL
ncbi:MAG: YihY family inner membrane protein [Desulfobacteraceae bacterium]|nr:YihY family inner membrane protein [Desulfobacteraceae bacterium]